MCGHILINSHKKMDNACENAMLHRFLFPYFSRVLLYSKIQGYYYWMASWKKWKKKKIIRFIEKECRGKSADFSFSFNTIAYLAEHSQVLIHSLFSLRFFLLFLLLSMIKWTQFHTLPYSMSNITHCIMNLFQAFLASYL